MKKVKILSVVGARPQFVKAAAFRKYCDENGIEEILLHTGQHYDPEMSTKIFDDLEVRKPEISHKLKARSHGGMTGEILANVEKIIIDTKPDFVNVYGDTNSTLAGALAASKIHVPVIHIEAGLRSFNKRMPEEINRVITDNLSTFLFCPTTIAVNNLRQENITNGVYHVGDIMYDAVKLFEHKFKFPKSIIINKKKPLAIMTVHRAETLFDARLLANVLLYCEQFADRYNIIFPVHPNSRKQIEKFGIKTKHLTMIEPVSYLEMQGMLREAVLVLTDSGGLQKEAYFHNCECITLRDETEWIETISHGWNRLWKTEFQYSEKKLIADYGFGDCCEKIVATLEASNV